MFPTSHFKAVAHAAMLGFIAALCFAAPANADVKAFGFSMKKGKANVEGVFIVDGYTMAEMQSLLSQYCRGGKVGAFRFEGKARKRRGLLRQKFTTECPGGPLERFKGSRSSFEIEFIRQGEYKNQHLVEITTSDGAGNLIYLRETTRP